MKYEGLMNFLWVFGSIGSFMLLLISLRLRLYVKQKFQNIGIIVLDTFTALNIIVSIMLSMVTYARYAQHRFMEETWITVICIWFLCIWVAVGRFVWWYSHVPDEDKKGLNGRN